MRRAAAGEPAAILAGSAAGFVAAATLLDAVRPELLLDRDPSWAAVRLLLTLLVAAIAAAAAGAVAAIVFAAGGSGAMRRELPPLALPRGALLAIGSLAFVLGAAARLAWIEQIPFPLFHDELLMVPAAVELEGRPADFRDAVRMMRDDAERPAGTVGVLYLEAFRASLRAFGTTVLGVRFLSALAGILSLLTAMLLGRTLLPSGGAALTGLLLAGLRWHLILSRFGWVLIAVVPLLDVAALAALRARRRAGAASAAAAGVLAGLGAHLYLSAWIAAAALGMLLLWPGGAARPRARLAAILALAFAATVAPLFLLREGRTAPYFVRAGNHNVLVEIRRNRSAMPVVRAARAALLSPWLPDPSSTNDLEGRARLPLLVALALGLAGLRALARPRDDLSALLFAQAAAALAASLAWGERMSPNGSRFVYLSSVLSVAAAAGLLAATGFAAPRWRRAVASAIVGGLFVSGAAAVRDLFRWDLQRGMYTDFVGQHTTVGRAAARWDLYGAVRLEKSALYGLAAPDAIRRYRVLERREASRPAPAGARDRSFRIASPGTLPAGDERVVEQVRDGWGKTWAVVLGKRLPDVSGP